MAKFSKQHYIMVANVLQNAYLYEALTDQTTTKSDVVERLADDFAKLFQRDNSRFDRDRFLRAVKGGE